MNNKGYALTGILYTILVVFLALILVLLSNLQNRKNVLSELKNDVEAETNSVVNFNYLYNELQTVDGKNNYIGEEQEVGTWTDGKIIYRRVFSGTTGTNVTIGTIDDYETIIKCEGALKDTSNIYRKFDSSIDSTSVTTYVDDSNNVVVSTNNNDYKNLPCFVIIEYTKSDE